MTSRASRLWIATGVLALSGALAGCAEITPLQEPSDSPTTPEPVKKDPETSQYSEVHVPLSDGRVITCIRGENPSDNTYALSCDWDNADVPAAVPSAKEGGNTTPGATP